MFAGQPANSIPFHYNQLQQAFLPLSPMNLLQMPALQVSSLVMPYLLQIATAAAMEIQNQAANNNNPLRVFMFNQMVQNNFQNQEFYSLVSGICDFIAVNLYKSNGTANVDQLISTAIPMVVQMFSAANARTYPALQQLIPQQTLQEVQRVVQQFDAIAADVNNTKAMIQQRGGGQQPAQMQPSSYVAPGWGGGFNAPQGGQQLNTLNSATTQLFASGNAAPSTVNPQGGRVQVSKYAREPMRPAAAAAPAVQVTAQNVVRQPYTPRQAAAPAPIPSTTQEAPLTQTNSAPIIIPAKGNYNLWRPSAAARYLPAYNPRLMELHFQQKDDGSLEPVLKKRNPQVEYDRHSTASVFGPPPRAFPIAYNADVLDNINHGVAQLQKEQDSKSGPKQDELPATHYSATTIADLSEDAAIFAGSLARLAADGDTVPAVFRAYARVAQPILGVMPGNEIVLRYKECRTFMKLAELMKDDAKRIELPLWAACHTKITATINRVLKQNLSLPSLSIDNFVDDIEDLVGLIGRKYGAPVQTAFLSKQEDIIKATFDLMYEDTAAELDEEFLGTKDPKDRAAHITYLSSDLSITYLNCSSYDLEVELVPLVGSAVDAAITPVLYRVMENIFADSSKNGGDFDRHLIITTDGRVLEAARGYLMEGFLILTLVK